MSSTKFIRFPFATSGDKAAIPDTVQVDGSVSYPEGFGVGYELELGVDAAALPVPRDESNQLYFDITSNLRAWQLAGAPEWATASQNGGVAVTYPKSALVRHNYTGAWLAYIANVDTSAEPGTSADWSTLVTKEYVDGLLANALPIGSVFYTARNTAPTNSLKANGAAVSRTTYAALFAAIGTTFGAGDGSTTFNVPDGRAEFLRGWDDGRGVDIGRVFGSWQKGSLVYGDNDGAVSYSPGTVGSTNPTTSRALIGLDPYTPSDYSEVTAGIGAMVTTQVPASSPDNFGVTRPNNLALLACIRY